MQIAIKLYAINVRVTDLKEHAMLVNPGFAGITFQNCLDLSESLPEPVEDTELELTTTRFYLYS
ncbi:MAG: hypothetical protein ACE5KA_05245 [Nitrososphaerales archaeon]